MLEAESASVAFYHKGVLWYGIKGNRVLYFSEERQMGMVSKAVRLTLLTAKNQVRDGFRSQALWSKRKVSCATKTYSVRHR